MIKDLMKNFQIGKYVFKFCPWYIFYSIVFIICSTLQALAKVYLIEYFIEVVEDAVKNKVNPLDDFPKVIFSLAVYLLLILVVTLYKSYYNQVIKRKYRIIFIGSVSNVMYNKARLVDYADFDNPEFYDIYSRAIRDGQTRGMVVYEDFINFIASIVNTIALGTYIVVGDSILIAVVLISVIVRIIIANTVNKNRHRFDKETEIDRRVYGYVNRTFYQQRFAAEIKSTIVSDLLIEKCNEAQKRIDQKFIQRNRSNTILNSISTIITNLFEHGIIYCYLVYKLFRGLTISRLSSMLNAATQFSSNFYDAASFLNKVKLNALYIDYFLDFMKYQPTLENLGTQDLDEPFERLKIDNVTFSYPGTDFNALDNINLEIKRGEKLAIVGLNGAGKTTLIKLLLKFYNPNVGDIYFNNQAIRDIKENVIRRKYSIVFQDFRLYDVTIAENILMHPVHLLEDEKKVWDALDKVNLKEKVSALPEGINTLYSREFNGVEFSGGERQKLAIARVFASNADIYILDEPTSSLDPIAEHEINQLLMEKAEGKTIIVIAHRLSTVVNANRIILIEYGKIIEEGTHHQLLMQQGKYYKMFSTQAALYRRNEKY